jgi:hypothetical protein
LTISSKPDKTILPPVLNDFFITIILNSKFVLLHFLLVHNLTPDSPPTGGFAEQALPGGDSKSITNRPVAIS